MNWFQGNIADAITVSKSTNAIFVVYVEGPDDMSRTMTAALDSREVSSKLSSSNFICIKLIKDSISHRQFTEIYKIVPVPSLFFIGESGVPMDIIAGDIAVANISNRVVAAIAKLKLGPPEQAASSAAPVVRTSASPSNSASVSGIEVKRESTPPASTAPATTPPATTPPATAPSSSASASNTPLVSTPPAKPVSEVKENHTASAPPEEVVAVESPPKKVADEEEKLRAAAEVERVQELIKKKREESQKQEEEKEREREKSRRKMGKEIAMAKKTQQERELEELRKERERDRKLELEARQRVLRQIEEDKANRAARANQVLSSAATSTAHNSSLDSPTAPRSSPSSPSNEARIQFKLPDGQTRTQSFPLNTTLKDLRSFIDLNIDMPFKEYTLATTFPRREFTSRDLNSDLSELKLLPSSVLLVLPVVGNRSIMKGPGWTATLSAMLWALIQPVLDIGSYLKSLITGGASGSSDTAASSESTMSNEEPSTSNTPSTQEPISRSPFYNSLGGGKSVRKRGNIHSLSDGNDSNDENNTWNGNSTQQM